MTELNLPLQFPLPTLGGWVSRQASDDIDYPMEARRVLSEQLGKRRPGLTDAQRCALATKG